MVRCLACKADRCRHRGPLSRRALRTKPGVSTPGSKPKKFRPEGGGRFARRITGSSIIPLPPVLRHPPIQSAQHIRYLLDDRRRKTASQRAKSWNIFHRPLRQVWQTLYIHHKPLLTRVILPVHRKKNIGIACDPDCYAMVETDQIITRNRGLHLCQITGLHPAAKHGRFFATIDRINDSGNG
jgi:hypothetical protein